MQQAPLSPGMGSLDRLDSLDEYFMLNSPPDSPPQPNRSQGQSHQPQQDPAAKPPIDVYGYYAGSGSNGIAPQGNVQQSTSNISVDRSNALGRNDSGLFGRMMPSTKRDIDEMLKMDDKDISDLNLTELFLKSNHRNSLNENYQAKGALKGHDKELHRNHRSNSLSSSLLEENERTIDKKDPKSSQPDNSNTNNRSSNGNNQEAQSSSLSFDFDVEPTPLSEIKEKAEQRKRMRDEANWQQPQQQQASTGEGLTSQRLDQHHYEQNRRQDRLQHSSNYYPFGRSYQLPIPTMPPVSPPSKPEDAAQPPLADAVATAAALASVQDPKTGTTAPAPNQSHHQHHTPPHSPPLHAATHPTWPNSDGTQVHHNVSSRPQSASPPAQPTHPQHQQYAHPPQHHPPHPGHPSYHAHHLATPLTVGTMPPGMHTAPPPPPKIVGPYTTAQQGGGNNNNNSRRRTSSSSSGTTTVTSKSGNGKTAAAPAPPASYLPRRGHHMPREASAAHSQPKAVLAEAAKSRRGHIGFHKPATSQTTNTYHHPLPQKYPNYAAPASSHHQYAKKSTTMPSPPPIATKPSGVGAQPIPPKPYANGAHHHRAPTAPPAVVNPPADTAYERKKQRAKDARVKLNESIERLHVAMGVAGSESKKRTEQLRNFMKTAGREHENHTDHQAFELMDSCVKTAESAKKWDRPNFVGSAATMISCLNSQCEILMKELMEYQEARTPGPDRPGRPEPMSPDESSKANHQTQGKGPESHEQSPQQSVQQADAEQLEEVRDGKRLHENEGLEPGKRRRLTGVGHCEEEKKDAGAPAAVAEANPVSPTTSTPMTICLPSGGPPVELSGRLVDLIACFLDPLSLAQCASVCKGWRGRSHSFQKDEIWEELCRKRFGRASTQHWVEKHADNGDDRGEQVRGMALYRAMSSANVMPSFQFNGTSHFLIGRGRLQNGGGAAAWLYLVERSNGETTRSVKRNPALESNRSTGAYVSLPVVELRIVIQNIGVKTTKNTTIAINKQTLAVDASTRRRGEELLEIDWDEKFAKRLQHLDGARWAKESRSSDELAGLGLFDAVVLVAFIHARRCSTTTKFLERSNYLRVLVSSKGTTQALVIPISNEKTAFQPSIY